MLPAGIYKLGPEDGTLSVRTGRTGAVAKAGHDLLIRVTAWEATLDIGEGSTPTAVTLDADAGSLLVSEGTGGMKPLDEDDMAAIKKTIDDDVLRRQQITFRSTEVDSGGGDRVTVRGDLILVGNTHPVQFDLLTGADGQLSATIALKQTDWGIKPYSALFGALKVADQVEVAIQASFPPPAQSR